MKSTGRELLSVEQNLTMTNAVYSYDSDIKVYRRRWVILILYNLFCFCNTAQWVQYTIIENVVMRYYNVSSLAIEWTAIIFSICNVIFVVPACYFMNKAGLRRSVMIGMIGTTIGAWLKVFAVSPDLIVLVYIGQFFISACQIPAATMPTRVSAYWFGADEISSASALGCVGSQLGLAIFLLIGPLLVKNHDDVELIGRDLDRFCMGVAVFCTLVCVLIIFFFKDQPEAPPSKARALRKAHHTNLENPIPCILRLLKTKNVILLLLTYGINVAVLNTISNMLNPLYLEQFENGEEEAGRIGLIYLLVGTVFTFLCGIILDKTREYKKAMIIIHVFTLIGQILFTLTLFYQIKWAVFVSATILGTFSILCFTTGYELCAEFTYPEPEEIAASLLNASTHTMTFIYLPLLSKLIEHVNGTVANISLIFFLILALVTSIIMKDERKRQFAAKTYIVASDS